MRRVFPGALAAALGVVTVCAAQSSHARFGVGIRGTFPTGDFRTQYEASYPPGNGFNVGWQGLAFVDVSRLGRAFTLRLDAVYGVNHANTQYKSALDTAFFTSGADASVKMFGGDADVVFGVPLNRQTGYVLGGIGVRWVTLSWSVSAGPDSWYPRLAWNAGGGVNFAGAKHAVFLEARYVHVAPYTDQVSTTNYASITLGLRF